MIKQNKSKKGLLGILGGICVLVGLAFMLSPNETATASATTTSYYTMTFGYDGSYSAYGMTEPVAVTATNRTSFSFGQYEPRTMSLKIYGSEYSGTATAEIGHYFNFNDVNILADVTISTSDQTSRITACYLRNSSGEYIVKNTIANPTTNLYKTLSKTLYSGTLEDDTYTLTYTWMVHDYMKSYPDYTSKNLTLTFTTTFSIDGSIPTVSGASTSTANYTNKPCTITAEDGNGDVTLYRKTPGGSYDAVGMAYTIGVADTNGLYSFYAKDAAENRSETYYVFYDSSVPTGEFQSSSGTVITGGCTNGAFSYVATDTGSGVDYVEYKTPESEAWKTYVSGTKILSSATQGVYTFRAVDKAGNVSKEESICLDTVKPTGTLYAGTEVVSSGSATNAKYIKFVAEDSGSGIKKVYVKEPSGESYIEYVNGSQYSENGRYYFYCTDNSGLNSVTYTVKLDNVAPILYCEQTNFYATYDCDFTVTASDALSTFDLYYKTPSMSIYEKLNGKSYTVKETDENGRYFFYAEDSLGNVTSYTWIELSVAYPEAQIVRYDDTNRYKITWSDDSTGTLNGTVYEKDTWITEEGEYTFVLTNKKQRTSTYTFSISHVYECVKIIEPTCDNHGYSTYQCKSCDAAYYADFLDPIGHNYSEKVVEVSCTKDGGLHHVCLNCGNEYVTDTVVALGHAYEQTKIDPTCTEKGCNRYTCTRCGYYYDTDVISAFGHVYVSQIHQQATCETGGYRFHICERCGENYTTDIPRLGHDYEITDEENDDGSIIRTYTCNICGHTYMQTLGNQYEAVSNYVEYLFKQYSPYMIWVFLATAGVWSVAMGVMFIVAHKNEDKAKAKKMLVNYGIGLLVIFGILVAAPYLVRGIAALIAG